VSRPHDHNKKESNIQGVAAAHEALILKLSSEAVWDAWEFVLKEPWEAVEGVNPRSDTIEKLKLATYNWWFATPKVEEDGQSEPGFPRDA
jgi:hypothetical protein